MKGEREHIIKQKLIIRSVFVLLLLLQGYRAAWSQTFPIAFHTEYLPYRYYSDQYSFQLQHINISMSAHFQVKMGKNMLFRFGFAPGTTLANQGNSSPRIRTNQEGQTLEFPVDSVTRADNQPYIFLEIPVEIYYRFKKAGINLGLGYSWVDYLPFNDDNYGPQKYPNPYSQFHNLKLIVEYRIKKTLGIRLYAFSNFNRPPVFTDSNSIHTFLDRSGAGVSFIFYNNN